jgi:hypothetical protein
LGCFSIDEELEGGSIDCQRAVATEKSGFTIGVKRVAAATYEVSSERESGYRQVRREVHYRTPFAGPYISSEVKKGTLGSDDSSRAEYETTFKCGVRLPASIAYFGVKHSKDEKRPPGGGNSPPTHRTQLEYGARIPVVNSGIRKMIERGDDEISITTERMLAGGSRTVVTRATNEKNKNPPTTVPMANQGESSIGEIHDSVQEVIAPARAPDCSLGIARGPFATILPSDEDARDGSSEFLNQQRYIVVGIFNRKSGRARERIMRVQDMRSRENTSLFESIRKASWKLWPLHKRLFSLKSISGFSLYHCHVDSGYHSTVEIDDRTKQTLFTFYIDYKHDKSEMDNGWTDWVHKFLNSSSPDPRKGGYTLELVLRWSITKIIIYGLLPVIGSFAVGIGYMQGCMSDAADFGTYLAVVQTAWGIASYVVGAAGGETLRRRLIFVLR